MRFFTSGNHRYFERMMRELPQQGHDSDSPPFNCDCRDCMEYNNRLGKCRHDTCMMRLPPYSGNTPVEKNCPGCKHYDTRRKVCKEVKCTAYSEP